MRVYHYELLPKMSLFLLHNQLNDFVQIIKEYTNNRELAEKNLLDIFSYNYNYVYKDTQNALYYLGLILRELENRKEFSLDKDYTWSAWMPYVSDLFKTEYPELGRDKSDYDILVSILEMTKFGQEKGYKPFKEHNNRYLLQCFFELQNLYDNDIYKDTVTEGCMRDITMFITERFKDMSVYDSVMFI